MDYRTICTLHERAQEHNEAPCASCCTCNQDMLSCRGESPQGCYGSSRHAEHRRPSEHCLVSQTCAQMSDPHTTMLCCREVRISPTKEEVLCKDPPWLPRNAASAYHPLEGVERLLDTHFRLLRHDSLQAFFQNAQQLLAPSAAGAAWF